ncbi:hypothetical protein SJAG_03821 [Schizosaccharomyces japonicus yFS275]|uniref:NADP-dependent oxidoreductase domain-containing protein n=1 Tax=Schizosaccharomyces japonicus (strain yFS275 / FY16936) TaxID=402676 RepID=B6K554_SCHJY|nr:hypothetical protein SJAG_03821 [Schizosaccharomyces japonicus yFS275]EEB08658.1 hypothetical protein SJAG_03821 [Schizosaccharomyces japonicus yFS275]
MSTKARAAGTVTIGSDLTVNRMGFGAMKITGDGIWDMPADKEKALDTLRTLPKLGVNFIDTADAYGPETSENLIREVLYPYKGLVVSTKGGLTRQGPGKWRPVGRPELLRQCVLMSLRRLGLKQLPLWHLHRIDPKVPREDQFSEIRDMQKEGLIRHVGLSEVTVADIKEAEKYFPVATVQNMYNIVTRKHEAVLKYCEENNIVFIPWFPLASGELVKPNSFLHNAATQLNCSPAQVCLAWLLHHSPVMLPIPGTTSAKHLQENFAAAEIRIPEKLYKELDEWGKKAEDTPYPPE